ncbi:MAG: GH92 family glycosyl hydrolase [Acidobacteriaceae bacterium]|nr:GH92 family glycosyl hydrolase [Acidobacteriaceae bacterium]
MGTNRRSFLKGVAVSAAGAVSAAAGVEAEAQSLRDGVKAAEAHAAAGGGASQSPLEMVNILQGTASTYLFSRGNTLPIAAVPFGMAHWTLESNGGSSPWFFHPGERRLEGVRCTHQLSPWLNDYGYATFLPVSGAGKAAMQSKGTSWRPEEATLSPAEMGIDLLRYRSRMELAPTAHGAVMQVTYAAGDDGDPIPAGKDAGLAIDMPGGQHAEMALDASSGLLRASNSYGNGGLPQNFRAYYVVEFVGVAASELKLEVSEVKSHRVAVVRYPAKPGVAQEIRIGHSFISYEQAERNLKKELSFGFREVRRLARAVWEEHLNRAKIEGGTLDQRRTFYSCMYRAMLFPRMFYEMDANGKPVHYSAFNGKVEPGVMYADHGYWDVYRAWYPWMSVMFPERLGEILESWVNAYREGGWMPQFPAPGYRACMTGSLIDAVFADGVVKDVPGFDVETAYQGLKKHATEPGNADKGYGRRGVETYMKLGYVPEDEVHESAAETVDAAFGDFCLSQIAEKLGHTEDAAMFRKRAENWRNLFDKDSKFLRGKNADGSWVTFDGEPFNPVRWGSPYVEGAGWQHRFDVPHEPEKLFEAMGGDAYVAAELEKMITMPATFDTGAYGMEIHEISEMAARHFGQYAHNNQPVHHILYLAALAGKPERTRYWVRRVMEDLYSPDEFAGDEDTGSMAAWFLMSAAGFYSVCPGKPEYVLGAPFFDRMTLTLSGGKKLVITRKGDKGVLKMNGKAHTGVVIAHKDVVAGGTLEFA